MYEHSGEHVVLTSVEDCEEIYEAVETVRSEH